MASITPAVRARSALMEEARTISSLSPVARMAIPGRVKKNTPRAAVSRTTMTRVRRSTWAFPSRKGLSTPEKRAEKLL